MNARVGAPVCDRVVLVPQLREVEWRGARVRLSPQRFHLLMVLAGWPPEQPARGNASFSGCGRCAGLIP